MMEKQPTNKTGQDDKYVSPSRLTMVNEIISTTFDAGPFFQSLLQEKRQLEEKVLPPKVNIVKNE